MSRTSRLELQCWGWGLTAGGESALDTVLSSWRLGASARGSQQRCQDQQSLVGTVYSVKPQGHHLDLLSKSGTSWAQHHRKISKCSRKCLEEDRIAGGACIFHTTWAPHHAHLGCALEFLVQREWLILWKFSSKAEHCRYIGTMVENLNTNVELHQSFKSY